jgi:hypothetical protein
MVHDVELSTHICPSIDGARMAGASFCSSSIVIKPAVRHHTLMLSTREREEKLRDICAVEFEYVRDIVCRDLGP